MFLLTYGTWVLIMYFFITTVTFLHVLFITRTSLTNIMSVLKEIVIMYMLLFPFNCLLALHRLTTAIYVELVILCVVTIGIIAQTCLITKELESYYVAPSPFRVLQSNSFPVKRILEWTSHAMCIVVVLNGLSCFSYVMGDTMPLKYRDTVYKENVSLTEDCGFSELLLSDIVRLNCELAWSRNTWDDLTAFNKKYGAVRMLTIPVDSTIKLSEGTTFEIDDSVKWDVIYGPLYCIPSADVTTQYEVTVEQASASYTTNIRFKEEGTYIFVAHPRELNNTEWEETFILDVVSRDWL